MKMQTLKSRAIPALKQVSTHIQVNGVCVRVSGQVPRGSIRHHTQSEILGALYSAPRIRLSWRCLDGRHVSLSYEDQDVPQALDAIFAAEEYATV